MLQAPNDLPYSEPLSFRFGSPFYKEKHIKLIKKIRNFIDKEINPFIDKWEELGDYPTELHKKAYNAGVYEY